MAVSPFNRGVSIVDAEGEPASYNGKTDTSDGFRHQGWRISVTNCDQEISGLMTASQLGTSRVAKPARK